MAWLRLIRWPNLLIVALTQAVAWWCVIHPLQGSLVLTPGNFALLCLSTVLIAAAGYIINDYFDIRIDTINKPGKVILDRAIPRRLAIIVHSALNVVALMLVARVALSAGHPEWILLQMLCIFLLWRYSITWKRQFITGNLVVALLTMLTIVTLIIYERSLVYWSRLVPDWHPHGLFRIAGRPDPVLILVLFAAFAFLLTWMREIVKDMEDYKGDDAEGCETMPIRWGLLRSTRFVQILGMASVAMLLVACITLWQISNFISCSAAFIFLTLVIPLTLWIIRLPGAATVAHYHQASTRIKWIMVAGIGSLLVLNLLNYA